MHRSFLRIAAPRKALSPLPRSLPLSLPVFQAPSCAAFASTSSPKEAEEASAQSGGSRSKGFKEEAESKHTGSTSLNDSLADRDARGRTGGGKPLQSSDHAPAQPKIWNASAPAEREKLTEEQRADVDKHNKEFEEKHDHASPAENDKVDKTFWTSDNGKTVRK